MGLHASSDKKVGGSNKEWFKVFFFVLEIRIEDRLGKFSLIQLSEEHPNGMRRVVKSLQEHQSGVHESRERVGKDAEKPIKVSLRCLAYLNKP